MGITSLAPGERTTECNSLDNSEAPRRSPRATHFEAIHEICLDALNSPRAPTGAEHFESEAHRKKLEAYTQACKAVETSFNQLETLKNDFLAKQSAFLNAVAATDEHGRLIQEHNANQEEKQIAFDNMRKNMLKQMTKMSHLGILIFLKDVQPDSEKTVFSAIVENNHNLMAFPGVLKTVISEKKFPVQLEVFAKQLDFCKTPDLLSKRALHNLLFWSVGFQIDESMFEDAVGAISNRMFTFRAGVWVKTLKLAGMTQAQIKFQAEQVEKGKNDLNTMYSELKTKLAHAAENSACQKHKKLFNNLSNYLSENKQNLLTSTVSLFSIVLEHLYFVDDQTIDEKMQESYASHWQMYLKFRATTSKRVQELNEQRETLMNHERDLKKSGERIAQERTELGKTYLNQIDACNKACAEVLAEKARSSRLHASPQENQHAQLQLQTNTLLQKLIYQPGQEETLGFLSVPAVFWLQTRHVLSPEELKKRTVGDSQLPSTSVASSYASVPDLFLALKDALETIESNRYSVVDGEARNIIVRHSEQIAGHAAYADEKLPPIERGRIVSSLITMRRHSVTGELFIHHMRPEKIVGQFHKPANLK